MNSKTWTIATLLLAALLASPALAQTCEVSGAVEDRDGNPIQDVTIRFIPAGGAGTPYDGSTNKKGRYWISSMFNPSNEGMWDVEVSAEGWVPVAMEVESRNAQRVLMGDVRKLTLSPGAPIPQVMVRPLGSARVDFVLARADEVTQAAPAPDEAEPGSPAPAAPQADPWDTALTRVSEGDLAGSIEFFDKAIEAKPDDPQRRETLAKIYYRMDRYDEAEQSALKAIELAPQSTSARMVLYSVYVGKGDLERAAKTLQEAREIAPNNPEILRQMAYVAGESGDTGAAIAANQALVELDPTDAQSWLALADLYADQGDMAQSEAAYQKLVDLDPGEAPQVFFNLGALIMNKEDRSEDDTKRAISAFRKAIELKPDYRDAHKQLAFALLGSGDRAGARTQLEECVRLAPDAPDSAQMKALLQSLGQ